MAKWPGAVAKCHYRTGTRRSDPRQGVQLRDGCPVERQSGSSAAGCSVGRATTERKVGRQPGEGRWAHSGDPIEPCDAAERPPALAIRHDPLRQRRPDPGEPLELPCARPVGVDSLTRSQRPGEGQRELPLAQRVAIGRGVEQNHWPVVRRRHPPAGPDQVPGDAEPEHDDEGAALMGRHARQTTRRTAGSRYPRTEDGTTEGGTRPQPRPDGRG